LEHAPSPRAGSQSTRASGGQRAARVEAGGGRVVDGRELRLGDPGQLQHAGIPPAADLVEQAGAGGHGEARDEPAGEPGVQILAEAAPRRGAREDLRSRRTQPAELGWEERGVQRRAAPGMDPALVVRSAERGGRHHGPGVRPGDDRREGPARRVEREEAVPEDRDTHRGDPGRARPQASQAGVDRPVHRGEQALGVQLDAAVGGRAGLVAHLTVRARLRAAARVEGARAGGAGADVEREDEHVRYYTTLWSRARSAAARPRSRSGNC
jgi:hypothetical protein